MQVGHRTKTLNYAVYFRGVGRKNLKSVFSRCNAIQLFQVELEMLVDGLTSPCAGEDWPKAPALLDLNPSQGVI